MAFLVTVTPPGHDLQHTAAGEYPSCHTRAIGMSCSAPSLHGPVTCGHLPLAAIHQHVHASPPRSTFAVSLP
jgi:hypothetical protein